MQPWRKGNRLTGALLDGRGPVDGGGAIEGAGEAEGAPLLGLVVVVWAGVAWHQACTGEVTCRARHCGEEQIQRKTKRKRAIERIRRERGVSLNNLFRVCDYAALIGALLIHCIRCDCVTNALVIHPV